MPPYLSLAVILIAVVNPFILAAGDAPITINDEFDGPSYFLDSDADGDGLENRLEIQQYGTDPYDADTDGDGLSDAVERNGPTDPTLADTDRDGLSDSQESGELNTTATTADTDDDGLTDGSELKTDQTSPTSEDTDGDGLADGVEVSQSNTDPTVADTDSDGVTDGVEWHDYGTDPTVTDTDGDGLTDGAEITQSETDPTDSDTDTDGLSDSAEMSHGTDPEEPDTDTDRLSDWDEINLHGTDPTQADTDQDGLTDGAEIIRHTTNPTQSDTDADGLSDAAEIVQYGTHPSRADTDGDELSDRYELSIGLTPTSAPECLSSADSTVDSDSDQLNNLEECRYGTAKFETDTDGDGYTDAEEVRRQTHEGQELPQSNPLRKDLYVVYTPTTGTDMPMDFLSKKFNSLAISNPNGNSGISLHTETRPIDERVRFTGNQRSFTDIRREYKPRLLGDKAGAYRVLLIAQADTRTQGWSEAPGDFSVAADGNFLIATHELLHAVTGHVPNNGCTTDPLHVCTEDGLLNSYITDRGDYHLSEPTSTELNQTGMEGLPESR